MQSSIFLCLSQARTNWEGCGRKGIRRKVGDRWRWIADWSRWSGAHQDCRCVCLLLSSLAKVAKSRRSFLLAPAHPGGLGKRAVKRLCCGISQIYKGGGRLDLPIGPAQTSTCIACYLLLAYLSGCAMPFQKVIFKSNVQSFISGTYPGIRPNSVLDLTLWPITGNCE